MIRLLEHDFSVSLAGETEARSRSRKARVLRRVFGRFQRSLLKRAQTRRSREIPVVVVVVRVLEANIATPGCHAYEGTQVAGGSGRIRSSKLELYLTK